MNLRIFYYIIYYIILYNMQSSVKRSQRKQVSVKSQAGRQVQINEIKEKLKTLGMANPQGKKNLISGGKKLGRLYNIARNAGFNSKSFTRTDLEKIIKNEKEFDLKTDDEKEITESVMSVLRQKLVGEVMASFTFDFPAGENLLFVNADFIVNWVERTTEATLKALLSKYHFHLKFEFLVEMLNIDGVTTNIQSFPFPKDKTLDVNKLNFNKVMNGIKGSFVSLIKDAEDHGDTKWILHALHSMTLKIAKNQYGGCENYKLPQNLFEGKKCIIQPSNKDNLCFWRCLAMSLFPTIKNIKKPHIVAQKQKAIKLQNKYCQFLGKDRENFVNLSEILNIADYFEIHILSI